MLIKGIARRRSSHLSIALPDDETDGRWPNNSFPFCLATDLDDGLIPDWKDDATG